MDRFGDGVVVLDALSAEILVGTLGLFENCVLHADEPALDELALLLGLDGARRVERLVDEMSVVTADVYRQLRSLAEAGGKIDRP